MFNLIVSVVTAAHSPGGNQQGLGQVTVDVEEKVITSPSGARYVFEAPETLRQMLMQGLDEIALTLSRQDAIDRFRAGDRARRPWAY